MKKNTNMTFIVFFVICCISSSGLANNFNENTTPDVFIEKSLNITQKMKNYGSEYVDLAFIVYDGDKNIGRLASLRTNNAQYIDATIAEYKSLEDIGGSSGVSRGMIHYLKTEKTQFDKLGKLLEKCDIKSTSSDLMSLLQKHIDQLEKPELKAIEALRKELDIYIKRNNLDIVIQ